jgi:putative salt-induced outer membrane protein YdiY
LRFETLYGEGTILIPFDRLQEIRTQRTYVIRYEEGGQATGRIWGIQDQKFIVGEDIGSAKLVPVVSIQSGISNEEYEKSFFKRLKSQYPNWTAGVDFGFSYETGAVEKRKIEIDLFAEYRKRPTRFVFDFRYALELQSKVDLETGKESPEVTTKDEFRGVLLGERDLGKRIYLFALPIAEWDIPRGINFRFYPTVGLGYRFVEKEKSLLQFQIGAGFVFEDFIAFGTNEYVCAHIGLEGRYEFMRGIVLGGRMWYFPSIENPHENWLFRGEVDLTIPLVDPLALKLRIQDTYDNNPLPEVGHNKFTSSILLVLRF